MRIDEFTSKPTNNLDYDLLDDVMVFMRNDPTFYRRKYFPAISDCVDKFKSGENFEISKIMDNVVDAGINSYCKKYDIARKPADIFTLEDRQQLLDKLCSEEMQLIEKGAY